MSIPGHCVAEGKGCRNRLAFREAEYRGKTNGLLQRLSSETHISWSNMLVLRSGACLLVRLHRGSQRIKFLTVVKGLHDNEAPACGLTQNIRAMQGQIRSELHEN